MNTMNINKEPNLLETLEWLKDPQCATIIFEDVEKLYYILYFFNKDNAASLYGEIKKLPTNEFSQVYKNIALLFPLSRYVLKQIMDKFFSEHKNKEESIGEFLDVAGNTMVHYLNDILFILQNDTEYSHRLKEYRNRIEQYEKEKNKQQEKLDKLKSTGSMEKALQEEVHNLENEVKELEKSYTKAALEKKKQELNERKIEAVTIRKTMEETQTALEKINAELEKYTNENVAHKLANLKQKTNNLPEDGE